MKLILKGVKPADYSFLLEITKRLHIKTETIDDDCMYLPESVIKEAKKALREVDNNQLMPFQGMKKMLKSENSVR